MSRRIRDAAIHQQVWDSSPRRHIPDDIALLLFSRLSRNERTSHTVGTQAHAVRHSGTSWPGLCGSVAISMVGVGEWGRGGRKGLTATRAPANFLFLFVRLTRKQRGERRKVACDEDGAQSRKRAKQEKSQGQEKQVRQRERQEREREVGELERSRKKQRERVKQACM